MFAGGFGDDADVEFVDEHEYAVPAQSWPTPMGLPRTRLTSACEDASSPEG